MQGNDETPQEVADRSDAEAALWRIFFHQNRDAIVILRDDGSVYRANDSFATMHGYSTAETEHLHVWDWNSEVGRHQLLEILQSVEPCGDFFETRHRRKNGRKIDVEIASNATYYQGEKLIFCHCRDITVRNHDQERIKRLATTDSLTGITNRREFNRCLTAEIQRALRFQRPLSLVMYDLDHFKSINDIFGHQVGDEVLKATVKLINKRIRQVDIHARWGGEEFMVLLPESGLDAALKSAERLCSAIANHPFKHRKQVTASFGVTVLGPEDQFDTLIKRADDALYLAKHSGRNNVKSLLPDTARDASNTLPDHRLRSQEISMVGPAGLEPATKGL